MVISTLSKSQHQQILDSLGIVGSAGEAGQHGKGITKALVADPNKAATYEAAMRKADPTFTLDEIRSQIPTSIPITSVIGQNAQNPELPKGTEFVPELMQVKPEELQTFTPINANANQIAGVPRTTAVPTITAAQAQGQAVDANEALAGFNPNAGQVQAAYTQAVPQMQAEQGAVSDLGTVQGQLKKLYGDMAGGQIPEWAKGAVAAANGIMGARGLGSSTIAGRAIAGAIQQQAINIAAPDAAAYFAMDMKNLDNRQQASLENTRMAQQNMLTDTAIANTTAQINAANEAQTEQFVTTLISQIKTQNADRATSVSQFNAQQKNQVDATNAQNTLAADQFDRELEATVQQFNSKLKSERETFNATMQATIDQSNVAWRRSVNTANTAAINAALATNVQNKLNISQVAQNNLWQQFRDEAAWSFTAFQDDMNRNFNAAQAANNRSFNSRNDTTWMTQVGKFAAEMFMN